MKGTPASTRYEPSTVLAKESQTKGGVYPLHEPRFDEYAFNKLITKSPSPADYTVAHMKDIAAEERFRAKKLQTFGNGKRFYYESYNYTQRIPVKVELSPSPAEYSPTYESAIK